MGAVVFVACSLAVVAQAVLQPEVAFELSERDVIPEGIAYDPVGESFYLSSTYRRKIIRVSAAGNAEDFVEQGAHGLWGVVGMTVDADRRLLWAASSHAGDGMPMIDSPDDEEGRAGLFAFHLDTGELAERFLLTEGSYFLNDVALTPSGDVLVTDSRTRVVYRTHVAEGAAAALVPFVELAEYGSPNGITLSDDGTTIFVAVGSDIVAIGADSPAVHVLSRPEQDKGVIDGLYYSHGSLIAMQPFVDGAYVVRLRLSSDRDAIVEAQPLVARHEALDQPTTGVIVGDEFFFVANSQLQRFRNLEPTTSERPSPALKGPVVLRTSLN